MKMTPGLKDNLIASTLVALIAFVVHVIAKQHRTGQTIVPVMQGAEYTAPSTPVQSTSPDWSKYTFNQPSIPGLQTSVNPITGVGPAPIYTISILVPPITAPQFGSCSVCG